MFPKRDADESLHNGAIFRTMQLFFFVLSLIFFYTLYLLFRWLPQGRDSVQMEEELS